MKSSRTNNNSAQFNDLFSKAQSGDSDAQWRLAVAYAKGRGTLPNIEHAIKWYRVSANGGHRDARYALYVLCESEDSSLSKTDPEAPSWYEAAVECGRPGAAFALAKIYEDTYNTSKKTADEQLALKYYLQAADLGDRNAYVVLFRLAQSGFGSLSQRDPRATIWRQHAANHGDSNAQFSLANTYEQTRDLNNAVIWYQKAGQQDHVQALACLDRLAAAGNSQAKEALIRIHSPKKLEQLKLDYQLPLRAQTGDERARKAVAATRGVKDDPATQTAFFSSQGTSDAYKPLMPDEILSAQSQPTSVVLGSGSFGDVYALRIATSGKTFAMKVLPLPAPGRDSIIKELEVLKRVQSAGIIGFYGSFERDHKLHLLLELAVCTIARIIPRIPARYALQLLRETAYALAVLHAHQIIHRDLKPDNLLLGTDGHIRVADFSVSKLQETLGHTTQATDGTGGMVGTVQYAPPEAFEGDKYTEKGDVYALGLIAHALATKSLLYVGQAPAQIMRTRLNQTPTEKKYLSDSLPSATLPAFSNVIARSCDRSPSNRWTMQQAQVYLEKELQPTPVSGPDITQVVEAVRETMPAPQRTFYPAYF